MKTMDIAVNGKTAKGYEITLQNASLVIAVGEKGYVICGYLNPDAAEKFADRAAIVKGVKTVDELLQKQVVWASKEAKKLGVTEGLTGRQALEKFV